MQLIIVKSRVFDIGSNIVYGSLYGNGLFLAENWPASMTVCHGLNFINTGKSTRRVLKGKNVSQNSSFYFKESSVFLKTVKGQKKV